jgi:hypothetical protein
MSNLRNLGNEFSVPIRPDEDGYIGRECPVDECLGYFKITLGTGIKGPAPCHCPYCGHSGDSNTFFTREQIEYAQSVVLRKVGEALTKDLKTLEFEHKPRGMLGIGISLKLKESPPLPIRYYREKQLETEVICDNCTLRYAIYGVFGWCPDCGAHNSLQILGKNLELAKKELGLAGSSDKEMADHLVGDALENAVSAFDGFGREICLRQGVDISFQNLPVARRRVEEKLGVDFASVLATADWQSVCRAFLKRHLLAHTLGVVDEEYIQRANDPTAAIGRKVRLNEEEVRFTICAVEALGKHLFEELFPGKLRGDL